jgi:hypothetical protein
MFVQKHFPVLKMILQKVLDDGVPVPKTEDKSVLPSALNRQESDDPSSHSDTELKVIEGEHEPLVLNFSILLSSLSILLFESDIISVSFFSRCVVLLFASVIFSLNFVTELFIFSRLSLLVMLSLIMAFSTNSDTRKAKPQVLLMGTSNVIGIRQDKLTTAADVTKVVRYTI